MDSASFDQQFASLTGHPPFPWQRRLYERFCADDIPASCNLPTGLGKTSVIAVWLLARQARPELPRRLVYVVNRRTVVDQTTDEVEKYLRVLDAERKIPDEGRTPEQQAEYHQQLELARRQLAESGFKFDGLALSTLRGQFADNAEWSRDPSRPAVICGTVDMIGSRLLFTGYGIGMRAKPLHAGFLGQDALLVHDEAHLEPAFQDLLGHIEREQARCRRAVPTADFRPLRVMELTATSRGGDATFPNDEERRGNEAHPEVQKRVGAAKKVVLHPEGKKLADQLADFALAHRAKDCAVLVFARKVEDVLDVVKALGKQKVPAESVAMLTGTLRGRERDALAESDPIFARFLPDPPGHAATGTVYLVCTSAGEVGVNISADHLVCDLSTFESMAQRFGRVNRFGRRDDTVIDVVHPPADKFGEKDFLPEQRRAALALLERLNGDGSPSSLGRFTAEEREGAFAPEPVKLTATDILFDAWALTTIKGKLPGRPAVEPYLHGLAEWEPPATEVAWREEVGVVAGDMLTKYDPQDLLDDYPLKPHEVLREPSYRAFKQFEALAKRCGELPAWLVDDAGAVEVVKISDLADKDKKDRINKKTVVLPPAAAGLSSGMLDGGSKEPAEFDVADDAQVAANSRRVRVWATDDKYDEKTKDMHLIRRIDFDAGGEDEDAEGKSWHWFEAKNEGDPSAKKPVDWQVHVDDVVCEAEAILKELALPAELAEAVRVAASLHDHGKRRERFQQVLGNANFPAVALAKSGKRGGRTTETYRHEFGSLTDARAEADYKRLSDEQKDLVLHLIAAHHGYARPHFPIERAFDPGHPDAAGLALAAEVPARFARLQRKYGRWGLAYLESLLRAADWAASASPSPSPGLEGQQ